MGTEVERKFLTSSEAWRGLGQGVAYRQGFLSTHVNRVVRVRVAGDKGTLTIKGKNNGITRAEFEYPIPLEDAHALLDTLCEHPMIEKVRYTIEHEGLVWEVDEFQGENAGLIVAEVELPDENHSIVLPDWVGEEVSDDPRYFNANLVAHPFSRWNQS